MEIGKGADLGQLPQGGLGHQSTTSVTVFGLGGPTFSWVVRNMRVKASLVPVGIEPS